jgi:hypothetical protein
LKQLLLAGAVVVLGAVMLVVVAPGSLGQATPAAATCSRGAVKAVIARRSVCLNAGKRCARNYEAQYKRYGFHCRKGRLRTRNALVTIAGPDEVVYDAARDRCAVGDWPDGDVRAFRDGSGQVQVVMPSIYSNRRLVGPDLNHLRHDCTVTLDSNQNPDPAAYDNGQWLGSVYSPDGTTVYGLTHMEYVGALFPGMCPVGIDSPDAIRCWWNSITLVVSTDGGRSYHRAAPRNGLVGALPYRYDPSGIGFEGMGLNGVTQIVRNPADGYYYAISGDAIAPQLGVEGAGYNCLMRTKMLADPTSWRGWDGHGFTRTFVDPYREPTEPPDDHVCKPINITSSSNNLSLSWNTTLKRWLIVYQSPAGAIGSRPLRTSSPGAGRRSFSTGRTGGRCDAATRRCPDMPPSSTRQAHPATSRPQGRAPTSTSPSSISVGRAARRACSRTSVSSASRCGSHTRSDGPFSRPQDEEVLNDQRGKELGVPEG